MSHAFVRSVTTVHTGGNVNVDVIQLQDGQVVCIGADSVSLYQSREEFDDNQADFPPTIFRYPQEPA